MLVARRAERLDVLAKETLKEGAAGVETLLPATLTESDGQALSVSSACPCARAQWAQQKNWPPT